MLNMNKHIFNKNLNNVDATLLNVDFLEKELVILQNGFLHIL
ncbi:hypothetical protein JTT07_08060 [Clostridium botulinum]|nr:hypothetical protein [Clostridium botulinum]MCS4524028.1 hypothetical protein [Clostridium botulinum]